MLAFALRRIAVLVPTLFVIITLSFLIIRLAPGGPFDAEQALPPAIKANLEAAYGLDAPLLKQYFRYMVGLLQGDFGPSLKFRDLRVSELIAQGLPVSLALGACAMLLAIVSGVPLGVLAALRQNGALDHAIRGVAVLGLALPGFVVGPLLALIFGLYLQWLPVAGWDGNQLSYLVLPVITLALPVAAYVSRLTRASFLEVMRSNHIRTARAKGIGQSTRGVATCAASRASASRELSRPSYGVCRHRLARRGDGIRAAGNGSLPRAGRDQSRLHARDGHDRRLRHRHTSVQFIGGSDLRLARPARAP